MVKPALGIRETLSATEMKLLLQLKFKPFHIIAQVMLPE
jgi:hypothetical protein